MSEADSTLAESSIDDIDLDLLEYLQSLTPQERIQRHDGALELVLALRKAAIQHYGFDPRVAASADDEQG